MQERNLLPEPTFDLITSGNFSHSRNIKNHSNQKREIQLLLLTSTTKDLSILLSKNDLQQIAAIIDVASTRGAFRGPELKAVGEMFEKVNAVFASMPDETAPVGPVESATTESN